MIKIRYIAAQSFKVVTRSKNMMRKVIYGKKKKQEVQYGKHNDNNAFSYSRLLTLSEQSRHPAFSPNSWKYD